MHLTHKTNSIFQIVHLYMKLRWCHTRDITECDVCDQIYFIVSMQNVNSRKIING